jgi:hypothetical protein
MSPLIDTSTGPISYDVQGAGTAIVMLSSGAHDRHDWDELRTLLPERVRTIALEFRRRVRRSRLAIRRPEPPSP